MSSDLIRLLFCSPVFGWRRCGAAVGVPRVQRAAGTLDGEGGGEHEREAEQVLVEEERVAVDLVSVG